MSSKKRNSSEISGASTDETAFPRGGAVGLAPLEFRDVMKQAEKDSAFEATFSGKTKSKKDGKKKPTKKPRLEDPDAQQEQGKRVEEVKYKKLTVGTLVLGIVREITAGEVVVSLPNNLTGYVVVDEISDELFAVCSDPDLELDSADFVNVGQVVRCVVLAQGKVDGKKRIDLSLRASLVNANLVLKMLYKGQLLTGSIASVQDHGYLVTLGPNALMGFLSFKLSAQGYKEGRLVDVCVSEIHSSRKTIVLSADPSDFKHGIITDGSGIHVKTLQPGQLVSARLRTVLPEGWLLSFLDDLVGSVPSLHLRHSGEAPPHNTKMKARILFYDPSTKSTILTLLPHLVKRSEPVFGGFDIGDIVEDAVVTRVDPGLGLVLNLTPKAEEPVVAYVHISRASDDHIDKLEKRFKPEKEVRCRVIGFSLCDGIVNVSLQESVLKEELLRFQDVKVGRVYKGKVISLQNSGVLVSLSSTVKGLCQSLHYADVALSRPEAKFKPGTSVRARVLQTDPENKRVSLTLKKSLVRSDLPALCTYADAKPGTITEGFITKIQDNSIIVAFYGGVHGLVSRSGFNIADKADPNDYYKKGQVVKCQVIRCESDRLRLSFHLGDAVGATAASSDLKSVVPATPKARKASKPGKVGPATVLEGPIKLGGRNVFKVSLKADVIALLEEHHLSDHPSLYPIISSRLKPGVVLPEVLVLENGADRAAAADGAASSGDVVVTLKQSLVKGCPSKDEVEYFVPSSLDEVEENQVLHGFVRNVAPFGVFVGFLDGLTGLAPKANISDTFVTDPTDHFKTGQSVRAVVLSVDREAGKLILALKQSSCYSADASFLSSYFEQFDDAFGAEDVLDHTQFSISSCVQAEVSVVKDYGCVLDLPHDTTGFVPKEQSQGVKTAVGTSATGRVLDIDVHKNIVDLTLRPELVLAAQQKSKMPKPGQSVDCVVQLLKSDYLVLTLPKFPSCVAYASVHDYNITTAARDKYRIDQKLQATVQMVPPSDSPRPSRLLVLLDSLKGAGGKGVGAGAGKVRFFDGDVQTIDELSVGQAVKAKVTNITETQINVVMGPSARGRIHITEVRDPPAPEKAAAKSDGGDHPFDAYTVGQIIDKVVVLAIAGEAGPQRSAELSVRPSVLGLGKGEKVPTPLVHTSIVAGMVVNAVVQKVEAVGLWVLLSPTVKGRVFVLDVSRDLNVLNNLTKHYHKGQVLRCRVLAHDADRNVLDMAVESDDNKPKKSKKSKGVNWAPCGNALEDLEVGMAVLGRVSKSLPPPSALSVQLSATVHARVHMCDVADVVGKDGVLPKYEEGSIVRAIVVDVQTQQRRVNLSLRPSVLSKAGLPDVALQEVSDEQSEQALPEVSSVADLFAGQLVTGFVKASSSKGVYVSLGRTVDARVLLSELSDKFVTSVTTSFPPGKLVTGRITAVNAGHQQVDLSLKKSVVSGAVAQVTAADIEVGALVKGVVKRIESYGVFVKLAHSDLTGLCHISQVSDDFAPKDLNKLLAVGDKVKAKVIKVEGTKISLCMKESAFNDEEADDREFSGEDSDEESSGDEMDVAGKGDDSDDENDSNDEDESDDDDDEALQATNGHMDVDGDDNEGESEEDAAVPSLDVSSGFAWDATTASIGQDKAKAGDSSDDDEEVTEAIAEARGSKKKREKLRKKQQEEQDISLKEKAMLEDNEPECADDFERLVVASPNSSYVWGRYMAWQVSMGEIDKARQVAERAIKTISFRDEAEKMKIWVALMNLEKIHGTSESLMNVFERAVTANDPKKIHFHLANIYEKADDPQMAEQIYKTMCRKFKTSCKVWVAHGLFKLKAGLGDAASKILDRSLNSLAKRKHIKVIEKFALMEFKFGSVERARTMFEGMVSSYPKRTDLWSVYLDMEQKTGDADVVRRLFDRVLTLKLNAKKIKFFFRKYLEYEQKHGTAETVEHVKQRARDYVERNLA